MKMVVMASLSDFPTNALDDADEFFDMDRQTMMKWHADVQVPTGLTHEIVGELRKIRINVDEGIASRVQRINGIMQNLWSDGNPGMAESRLQSELAHGDTRTLYFEAPTLIVFQGVLHNSRIPETSVACITSNTSIGTHDGVGDRQTPTSTQERLEPQR